MCWGLTSADTLHWQTLTLSFVMYIDRGSCKKGYAPCTDSRGWSKKGRAQAAADTVGRYQQARTQASPPCPLVWARVLDHTGWALLQAHLLGVLLGRHGAHHILHNYDRPGRRVRLLPHHIKGSDIPGLHGEDVPVSAEEVDSEAELQPRQVPGTPEVLQRSFGEDVRHKPFLQWRHRSSPWVDWSQMTVFLRSKH